ncbi:MAG: hypothetical protein GX259_10005 [Bacteroidales bacterium]|nr:hypothetical protein [Bacteroidales bacterium]
MKLFCCFLSVPMRKTEKTPVIPRDTTPLCINPLIISDLRIAGGDPQLPDYQCITKIHASRHNLLKNKN